MKLTLAIAMGLICLTTLQTYNRNELLKTEIGILRDQISDMTYEFSNTKTYAEGVRDGFEGSKDSRYAEGYHAAIQQFGTTQESVVTQRN